MIRRASSFLVVAAAFACAGDGSGIPPTMTGPGGPAAPTLTELQGRIFTPICSPCHRPGGIGPMPLDNEAATFANLVGVFSIEIPTLLRVAPNDPENSYLVWKIEGRPGIVGDPMPAGGPMLTQEQIDDIVSWIADGAMP